MNRKHFVLTTLLLIMTTGWTQACDICGCGAGSYYLGILPDFNKRFIGLRYQHKTLTTHLGPIGNRTPLTADETYESMELWGAWNFGERWRVMTILPYNINTRHVAGSGQRGYKDGFGDVAVMGFYRVFEQSVTTRASKLLVHSLWAGAGIKAPTGSYDEGERSAVSQDAPNNFQLGTASTDFMINAAYDVRLMDAGLNANVTYKINTANRFDYRYGNKLTANVLAYYKFNIQNKVRIAPNAGAIFETQDKDVVYGQYHVAQSGGRSGTGVAGIEINAGKVSLGGNFQRPLSQDLADGRVTAGNRWLAHVSFSF